MRPTSVSLSQPVAEQSPRQPARDGQLTGVSSTVYRPSTPDQGDAALMDSFEIPSKNDLIDAMLCEAEKQRSAVHEHVMMKVYGQKNRHLFFTENLCLNQYPKWSDAGCIAILVKLEDLSYRVRTAVMSAFMMRTRMAGDVSEGGKLLTMAAEPDSGNSNSALRCELQSRFKEVLEQEAPQEMVDLAIRMANRLASDVNGLTYLPSYYTSKEECLRVAKERLLHGIDE